MEDNPEEVVSTQKKLQSSHDPGWNDPPSWAFTPLQKIASGTPKRVLLNKRVAFPLNSKPETTNSAVPPNMPPASHPPPAASTSSPYKTNSLPPSGAKVEDPALDLEICKEEALKNTLENLRCLTKELEASKAEEIERRLERMESMWNEDKLNNVVYKQVLEISQALKNNEVEKADQLHISLMMSNASICSSWIPGIRQLILEVKNKGK